MQLSTRMTGTRETPSPKTAGNLDTRAFYGHFRVDPATGSQIGHKMIVVKWEKGKKISVYNG